MALSVVIGKTSSEKRALDKAVTSTVSLTGALHNQTNVVNPSVLIKCSAETIATCNYMTISNFGRSYFITDITSINKDFCLVSGHCDVLSTYKTGIRLNTATVARTAASGNWNNLLVDPMKKITNQRITTTQTGWSAFPKTDFSIMLITAG